MELATYIGISISEFWEITPCELSIMVKSFNKRKNDEAEEYMAKLEIERRLLTIQALQISKWVWKRPSEHELNKILNCKEEKKEQMTDDAMLNQVKVLNKLFGGEVKNNGNEE